ncbi:MAG: pilus assembly protein [Heyndrickxia sp.]
MKKTNVLKNEDGALSLEFLGILPLFFLLFLLLWQVVASGYAVFAAKTAVNEAAKTYSLTGNINEAQDKAREMIGDGSLLKYKALNPVPSDSSLPGEFTLKLEVEHYLVFLPDKWKTKNSLPLDETATGTELIP